eukprot:5836410-Pleurochrysis_carterae.AAC.3
MDDCETFNGSITDDSCVCTKRQPLTRFGAARCVWTHQQQQRAEADQVEVALRVAYTCGNPAGRDACTLYAPLTLPPIRMIVDIWYGLSRTRYDHALPSRCLSVRFQCPHKHPRCLPLAAKGSLSHRALTSLYLSLLSLPPSLPPPPLSLSLFLPPSLPPSLSVSPSPLAFPSHAPHSLCLCLCL